MDGAAPELNPGWVRRRKNTCPEVRYATQLLMAITPQIKNFQKQTSPISIVITTPLINKYFGVGVTSEAGMRSAGVEPRMGSSTEKHLPRSTLCHAQAVKNRQTNKTQQYGMPRKSY
ncbi:hypothetical protein [Pseudomonas sp. C27(2019)]|uniref:hypothetical protein n=1 Tax=Pseudomonas sp. C27(2019) TaxID=2604941 RepID=UPI0015B50C48|nr:hypothetical protein [Pseudomonas sp. C27(2019)]